MNISSKMKNTSKRKTNSGLKMTLKKGENIKDNDDLIHPDDLKREITS